MDKDQVGGSCGSSDRLVCKFLYSCLYDCDHCFARQVAVDVHVHLLPTRLAGEARSVGSAAAPLDETGGEEETHRGKPSHFSDNWPQKDSKQSL